jgi:protein-L-isoaspartate O-methyltransferase
MPTLTATYSPDDNKLRLYASSRLDADTYARVKAAGFRWAPKQDLFVAPAWTPARDDLLIELCGEIEDEDTSLVERAEERADRFGDYSDSRTKDAERARSAVSSIADGIPFGQPILVGHHSERRARKDAERIENGMRKALKMWDTAAYWQSRAAGALRAAKYKERSDVRARRIKGIEADRRKQERHQADAEKWLGLWAREGLTLEQARAIADYCHLGVAPSPYGWWSAYDVLRADGDRNAACPAWTVEQVQEVARRTYPATIAHAQRWIDHYNNRIAYERAMLDEQGGLKAEQVEIEVGGRVLIRGEWLIVVRLNKKDGVPVSVTTNARYVRVRSMEEITDYQAPTDDERVRTKAATKIAPMANYPGEGFAHMTKAQWEAVPKDYKGTNKVVGNDVAGAHRVRTAIGVYSLPGSKDWNVRHSYPSVYITDLKRVDPPAPVGAIAPTIPAPERTQRPAPTQPAEETPDAEAFDTMRQQLKQGVQVVSAPQLFPTPRELAARMVELAEIEPGQRVLEPSAGTGRLLSAFDVESCCVHAIEINRQLAGQLQAAFPYVTVHCEDFLQVFDTEHVPFDRIIMNPPFNQGQDIQHIQHAARMLAPGGRLVAICANGPRQHAALRPIADLWETLPPGTFAESGTMVNAALLVVTAG